MAATRPLSILATILCQMGLQLPIACAMLKTMAQNSDSLRLTPSAIAAAGRAFERASGRCECNGFACNAATHQHKIIPHGAYWHSRCTAELDGHAYAALLHPHDDAEDSDNYRVLCRACLE